MVTKIQANGQFFCQTQEVLLQGCWRQVTLSGCQWQQETTDGVESSTSRGSNIIAKQRTNKTIAHLAHTAEEWELLSRYHSVIKLKRVTGYALRFIKLLSSRNQRVRDNLTSQELRLDEIVLVKYIQKNASLNEIAFCR